MTRDANPRAIQEMVRSLHPTLHPNAHTPIKWTQCECLSLSADGQVGRIEPTLSRNEPRSCHKVDESQQRVKQEKPDTKGHRLRESMSGHRKLCSHMQSRYEVDRSRPGASGDTERQGWGASTDGSRSLAFISCFLMWTHHVAEDNLEWSSCLYLPRAGTRDMYAWVVRWWGWNPGLCTW